MLLFDIDGTLLLTGGAGRVAFEDTFRELFAATDAWGDTVPDGKTDPQIIQEIAERSLNRKLTDKEYAKLTERYHKRFKEELGACNRFRVMPGIPTLMTTLAQERRLLLGIATGNFQETARLKLKQAELEHYFSFGGYGSDSDCRSRLTQTAYERGLEKSREQIKPDQVFVIEDTCHDIRAGKDLGAITVGVTTGSTPHCALEEEGADFIVSDLADHGKFLEIVLG